MHKAKYNDMHLWDSETESGTALSDVHGWWLSEETSLLLPLKDDGSSGSFSTSGPWKGKGEEETIISISITKNGTNLLSLGL